MQQSICDTLNASVFLVPYSFFILSSFFHLISVSKSYLFTAPCVCPLLRSGPLGLVSTSDIEKSTSATLSFSLHSASLICTIFLPPFCQSNMHDLSTSSLQINDRVLQNILVAATLPSYGLRSIEKYIEKRFPLVSITTILFSYLFAIYFYSLNIAWVHRS